MKIRHEILLHTHSSSFSLLIAADKFVVNLDLRFAHIVQHVRADVFRCDLELAADTMMPDEFVQKTRYFYPASR